MEHNEEAEYEAVLGLLSDRPETDTEDEVVFSCVQRRGSQAS